MTERLFIALELPEDEKEKLHSLTHNLIKTGSEKAFSSTSGASEAQRFRIKGTAKDQLHLTLRFLGSVEKKKIEAVAKSLQKVNFVPFNLHLSGWGIFSRRRESILWAGLKASEALNCLKKTIDEALAECGFPLPTGRYSPHISLLRSKGPGRIPDQVSGDGGPAIEGCFKVSEFTLFKSDLWPEGARHKALSRYRATLANL